MARSKTTGRKFSMTNHVEFFRGKDKPSHSNMKEDLIRRTDWLLVKMEANLEKYGGGAYFTGNPDQGLSGIARELRLSAYLLDMMDLSTEKLRRENGLLTEKVRILESKLTVYTDEHPRTKKLVWGMHRIRESEDMAEVQDMVNEMLGIPDQVVNGVTVRRRKKADEEGL